MSRTAVHPRPSLGICDLKACIAHVRDCEEKKLFRLDDKTGAHIATLPGPQGTNWWPTRIIVDKKLWYVCPGPHRYPERREPVTIDSEEWALNGALYDPKDFEVFGAPRIF